MKPASVKEIKQELSHRSSRELLDICLRLAKYKKENKELLTYLLFNSSDETGYLTRIKEETDEQFEEINTSNFYYIKKSVRKILRHLKKYSRYSGKKETEVELLLYFCGKLKALQPSIHRNKTLENIYERQLTLIRKNISSLHEDLQHDFEAEIQDLKR